MSYYDTFILALSGALSSTKRHEIDKNVALRVFLGYTLGIKGTDEKLLKQSLERIQKELAILDKQMSSLHDLLEQGVYSIETFLERSNLLEKRIAAAQADKKRIEDELEKAALREKSKEEIVPAVMEVLDLYWQLESPADRNHLLKKVLDKAVYDKDAAGLRNGKGADDFRLVIYSRLP